MFLDREHRIQVTLDLVFAVIILILGDALRVNADLVDHATRGVLKVSVVLKEVGMSKDMRCHERILQKIIHLHEKSVTGIGVDHHLIDLAESKIILHLLPIISFTVGPVAKTAWQAVRCKLVHDRCWY